MSQHSRKRSRDATFGPGMSDVPRRGFLSAANTDCKQNRQIKALQNQVTRLSKGEELKYVDRGFTWSVANTASIQPMTNPALFTGDQLLRHKQREGQSVNTTKFMMKGTIYVPDAGLTGDANNRVRMLVVLMKDSGVIQSVGDIIENPGQLDSYLKVKPPNPYTVLYDRTFNLQNVTQVQTATNISLPTEKWRIPFSINLGKEAFGKTGTKATWLTDDGTTVQSRTGGVSIIVYSDSTLPSHPVVQGQFRWRFMDN